MSELQNPLFDEEKEFLERKKLEYERALLGDVEHIKDQSVKVGKVALVGAGLAGSVWLISKAFGSKKRKRKARRDAQEADYDDSSEANYYDGGHDGGGYYGGEDEEQSAPAKPAYKSAAGSAMAFMEHYNDDLPASAHGSDGQHSEAEHAAAPANYFATAATRPAPEAEMEDDYEEDPFQDLPYDDSRRLPTSHAFDDGAAPVAPANSRYKFIGSVLSAFLQSDTGKVLVAQAAAVAMALVTKKVSEFFPADKNADLAASPALAPASDGVNIAASPAPSVSLTSDASTPPQSL